MSEIATASGYTSPEYARSFAEFGEPLQLPRSGGWLLKRTIPGTDLSDAMGIYPYLCCSDWSQLDADQKELEGIVSLSLVTDPFGDWDEHALREGFPDFTFHYKDHYVVDLALSPTAFISEHNLSHAKKAQRELRLERCPTPLAQLDTWCGLYGNLIRRHNIRGLTAFSRKSFALQLQTPGLEMFRAVRGEETLAILLILVNGDFAHFHLIASSEEGYARSASHGLFMTAIDHCAAASIRWINLGAGAGVDPVMARAGGLARFKRGWASGARPVWFCGRIYDRAANEELMQACVWPATHFFPRYRPADDQNDRTLKLAPEASTQAACRPHRGKRPLVIVGAGGHATSVAGVARAAGYAITCFIDEHEATKELFGIPILCDLSELKAPLEHHFALAIGDNATRERVFAEIIAQEPAIFFPVISHPSAVVSAFSLVGAGTVLMPCTVVGTNSRIGRFCILNTTSSVDHDCSLGDFSSIAPGGRIGGSVSIGTRTAICMGAVVRHAITIGVDSVLGANSYLKDNLPSRVVAYGSPAKVVRTRRCDDPYL